MRGSASRARPRNEGDREVKGSHRVSHKRPRRKSRKGLGRGGAESEERQMHCKWRWAGPGGEGVSGGVRRKRVIRIPA